MDKWRSFRVVGCWAWKSKERCDFPNTLKKKLLTSICTCATIVVSNHMRSLGASCVSITQSGHIDAIIIKTTGKKYIILLLKINIAFLFTPSSPFCHCLLFINNIYVQLTDWCPQDASLWTGICFWCSINHKQHKPKKHLLCEQGGKQSSWQPEPFCLNIVKKTATIELIQGRKLSFLNQ